MRALVVALSVAAAAALAACASADEPGPPPADDAGAATDDAGAAGPPPIDPGLFDCTSLGRPPLPRRSTVSAECLRSPACTGRFVSAHRGAGGQLGRIAPEDTLAAYRAGIALGVDLVETDPRPTADGVLVNMHDTSVDRTTDGTGEVSEMTYDALSKLHVKADRLAGDFSCERVPTLEEILRTCKDRAFVLVDANKTDDVEGMVAAIHAADALDWAIFDTSDTSKIDRALALEPALMIMPRVKVASDAPAILAKYASHLPVFVEIDSSIFPKAVNEVHAAGTRTFTDAFATDFGVLSGDDRGAYVSLFDAGADVLQTDLPDEVLRAIGRPVPPP